MIAATSITGAAAAAGGTEARAFIFPPARLTCAHDADPAAGNHYMSVPSAAASPRAWSASSPAYQIALVALLSVNFGIVFFDRNALGFLMPFVQPDLRLSNTEVGMLSSALSLTWACAAFGIGIVSDRTEPEGSARCDDAPFLRLLVPVGHRRIVCDAACRADADGRRRGRHHADQPIDHRVRGA